MSIFAGFLLIFVLLFPFAARLAKNRLKKKDGMEGCLPAAAPRLLFLVIFCFLLLSPLMLSGHLFAGEDDYEALRMRLTNFVRCEMTRTSAVNHFGGKPFEITMINLFDSRPEGEIRIVTGAVQCWVVDHHETLHLALGVTHLEGHDKVSYFVVRKKNFSILATELMAYPYKERCPWSRYWIDTH